MTAGKKMTWRDFWQNMMLQVSDGLEKSTVGALALFLSMGCIVYLTIAEGGSNTVESLLTTSIIVAATLMGVNSVTDIFKKKC